MAGRQFVHEPLTGTLLLRNSRYLVGRQENIRNGPANRSQPAQVSPLDQENDTFGGEITRPPWAEVAHGNARMKAAP